MKHGASRTFANLSKLTLAGALLAAGSGVWAAPLPILTYSMENGQSGFTTYHDDTYGGPGASGNPNADGAFLSGGLGQLTDGVLGTQNIFDNGSVDWVGWVSIQPTITFKVASGSVAGILSFRTANFSPSFSDVGVFGSASVSFSNDGSSFFGGFVYNTTAADRTGDESRWVDIPLGNVSAQYVRVTLGDGEKIGGTDPGAKPWIFISEAALAGVSPVPEPESAAMLLVGLALIATVARWRKSGTRPRV